MKRKARNGGNQCEGDEGAGQAHGRTSLSAVVPIGMLLSWPVRPVTRILIEGGTASSFRRSLPVPAAEAVSSPDAAPVRLDDDLVNQDRKSVV